MARHRRKALVGAVLALSAWGLADPVPAVVASVEAALQDAGEGHEEVVSKPVGLEAFPVGDAYAPYLADPHRPGFALLLLQVSDVGIADSGSTRTGLKAGGSFGLLRVRRIGRSDHGIQLNLVAGFDAQFDIDNNWDNVGWDGNYGLSVTLSRGPVLAFKLGVLHTSSHIGDELIERTGRERINYTREEALAGVAWSFRPRWRTYVEAGYGYERRNRELQEPWRLQTGLEYDAARSLWRRRLGWYIATDLSATEERDFRLDVAIQAGLSMPAGDRRWRAGVEIYDGRPNLGEFFQDDEAYVAFGLWLDF